MYGVAGCARTSAAVPRWVTRPASSTTTSAASATTSSHDVRDHDRDAVELREVPGELRAHLVAQLDVERGERLVEQQHVRPRGERPRERDPLRLTAGELRRTEVGERQQVEPGEPALGLHRPGLNATFWRTVRCGNSR